MGAQAIRSLLLDTALAGRWALAVYIPESEPHYTEDDRRKLSTIDSHERDMRIHGDLEYVTGSDDWQRKQDWIRRRIELTKKDMRQFFRAGFVQVKEPVVISNNPAFLLASPSSLSSEMMSHDDALAIKVAEEPEPPAERSAEAIQLLKAMKKFCSQRNELDTSIKSWQVTSPWDHPLMRPGIDMMEESRSKLEVNIRNCEESIRQLEEQDRELTNLLSQMPQIEQRASTNPETAPALYAEARENTRRIQEMKEWISETLASVQANLDESNALQPQLEEAKRDAETNFNQMAQEKTAELQQQVRDLDANVRSEVTNAVEQSGYEVILESNVFHCCACNLVPDYIDMLMEFVPNDNKEQAINTFDSDDNSPLMTAASRSLDSLSDSVETCERIIRLGGDKDLVNANRFSALGVFRRQHRSIIDFLRTFGQSTADQEIAARTMEAMLMPMRGPTAADDEVLDSPFSDDDDVPDEVVEDEEN